MLASRIISNSDQKKRPTAVITRNLKQQLQQFRSASEDINNNNNNNKPTIALLNLGNIREDSPSPQRSPSCNPTRSPTKSPTTKLPLRIPLNEDEYCETSPRTRNRCHTSPKKAAVIDPEVNNYNIFPMILDHHPEILEDKFGITKL